MKTQEPNNCMLEKAKSHFPKWSSVPRSYLRLITTLIISFHLVSNICIPSKVVFLSFHVRMFRCKQHNVYTSQHINRTVSATVYGIYVFWLQGIIHDSHLEFNNINCIN